MPVLDENKGWTETKTNYRGQTTDENYQGIVGYHNPIWKYMINNHDGDVLHPINVIGNVAVPLAIELSQWGFPTNFITDKYEGVKKAKADSEIHSGNFKKTIYCDFLFDCPPAKVTIFINIIDQIEKEDMYDFLDMLLLRSREVVCAVRNDRDWKKLLSGKYRFNMSIYKDKQFCLLTLIK